MDQQTALQAVTQTIVTKESVKQQLLVEALDIIKSTKEGFIKAFDYMQVQIPDIIKQFLNWELSVGIILFVFGIFLMLGGLYLWRNYCKDTMQKYNGVIPDNDNTFTVAFVATMSGFTGFAFFFVNLFKIIHIIVAPKIFLIKWLMANIHI